MDAELRDAVLLIKDRVLSPVGAMWGIRQGMDRLRGQADVLINIGVKPSPASSLGLDTAGQMAEEIDFMNRMSRYIAFDLVHLIDEAEKDVARENREAKEAGIDGSQG